MTKEEWIELYEKKTGDKHELPEGYIEKYLPDRGYCQYGVSEDGKTLMIYETCGDGRFWYDVGLLICKEKGLKLLSTLVTRNIRAHIRFFGAKVEKEVTAEDGTLRLFGTTKSGEQLIAYPIWFDNEKEKYAYCLVTEVGEM